MDRTTINALMDRASSDPAAFGPLADAVQDELFRLALALGLRREDAVEVTQELLMRAFSRRATWKPGSDAVAWLCGFTVNIVREHKRHESQNAQLKKNHPRLSPPDNPSLDSDQLDSLAHALAQLPPRQQEAIACRYLRGLSIHETARAMDCAEGTVKSAVAAALDKLQAALEPRHEPR